MVAMWGEEKKAAEERRIRIRVRAAAKVRLEVWLVLTFRIAPSPLPLPLSPHPPPRRCLDWCNNRSRGSWRRSGRARGKGAAHWGEGEAAAVCGGPRILRRARMSLGRCCRRLSLRLWHRLRMRRRQNVRSPLLLHCSGPLTRPPWRSFGLTLIVLSRQSTIAAHRLLPCHRRC